MNYYTIRFHKKKTYRALENSYTCVRALYFELEIGSADFAKKPKIGS